MAVQKSQSRWTPAFALLCIAQFFSSARHALRQPIFPLHHLAGRDAIQGRRGARLFRGDERRISSGHRRLGGPPVGTQDPYLRFAVAVCGAASLIHSCRRSGDACQRVARFRLGRIEHLWLFIACLSPPPLWLDEASRYYSGVRASAAILLSTGIAALGLVATILNLARLK